MNTIRKLICILLLTALAASAAGCSASPSPATPDEAVTPTEAPVPATPDTALTSPPTDPPTEAPTEAPTEEPTEYTFRWTGSDPYDPYDSTGFVSVTDVIPDAELDIRYYSGHNFVGDRIDGYEEPLALICEEAAYALKNAADDLREQGYRIKIFDAYRPRRAVEHFASWASDWSDTRMKAEFYPSVDKSLLFDYGYIAYYSGHSRGSKVDMTLVDIATGAELDMGGSFDYFDTVSHPDCYGVTEEQYQNRMTLRSAMTANGFYPCATEWWDFTLSAEPYPSTYFDFPVSSASLTYRE